MSAILANKLAVAKEIFSRVQFIIENCPKWLQQGIKEWNKTSLVLENGSRVFCSATSPSAVRGFSLDNIFCDEFAHLNSNLADEFIASVFPTLSSSNSSKLIIVSTPKGMNHFYKIYTEAVNGTNGFAVVDAHWSENPGRDEKWLASQLAELGEQKFNQEVLCQFLGSSASLLNGETLGKLAIKTPKSLLPDNTLLQYEEPIKEHSYVLLADTARGKGLETYANQLVCEYLSNAQKDTASKIDDLPLAFGANRPIIPFNFVKSITLSSPYENIFENSNLIGFHTMFLAKSSSVSLLFNSVFNDLTFARD
jgi:hypothetical protein